MYADTFQGRPLNGCLFGDTSKGPQLEVAMGAGEQMPRRIDLRPYCSPVEDQGQTNSCVGNAMVGALELLIHKQRQAPIDLSRMFLYYNSRAIGGCQNEDGGTFINHAIGALVAHGICEERMWPFVHSAVNQRPTEACYANAQHYQTIQIARTPHEHALTSLSKELPVVFGAVLPQECYEIAGKTGVCPRPEDLPAQSPGGGHAMLAVGYDLDDKVYIIRNSWGPTWGDQGYFKMPIEVMQRYARADQFFTIGEIDKAPGLRIFGEAVVQGTAQMAAHAQAASLNAPGQQPSQTSQLAANLRAEIEGNLDRAKKGFSDRLRGGQ